MKKEFYLSKFPLPSTWLRRISTLLCALFILGIGISLNAQVTCTTSVVTCNDNVQISLDGDCSIDLTADMLLEDPCDDSFYSILLLDGTGSGSTLTSAHVGQTVGYMVTHNDSGNTCWGSISVEDKIDPVLECPADITGPVSTISGALEDTDDQYDSSAGANGCNSQADHYYDAFEFSVSETGMYTFSMERTDDFDGYAAIYEGFDPANPCNNILAEDDDTGESNEPEITINLDMEPGCYTLVTTSFFGAENDADQPFLGNYTWNFSSEAGRVQNGCTQTLDLLCVDLENVLSDSTITGVPIAIDGCGEPETSFSDELTDNGCNGYAIVRTWTATDGSGNTAECVQNIAVRSLELADVDFPENIDIECGTLDEFTPEAIEEYNNTNSPNEQDYDSYPSVTSVSGTYNLAQTACNLGATYTDSAPVDICTGSYKIARTWSVYDWCTDELETYTQLIKIIDTQAPVFTSCPEDFTVAVSAQNQNCEGLVFLPGAEAIDVCSGTISTVTASTPNGEFTVGQDGISIGTLGEGTYTITYTVTDDCGNTETCDFDVTLVDEAAPVAICDEHTVVAIGANGSAEVCAGTFDDGSYDNCQEIVIKVKRMDASASTPFTDCVAFDCADIQYDADGNAIPVMVRMRVYDLVDGFADNNDGRWNECMIEVEVQDKLDPVIECPDDITLDCGEDPYDFALTGEATAYDNCEVDLEYTNSGSLDNCGEGTIFRRWIATDAGGLIVSCRQRIRVINQNPFDESGISWPDNYTAYCEGETGTDPDNLPAGSDYPVITEGTCDLVAVAYEDTFLPISDTACYKILRLWTVIDWCQFDIDNSGVITDGHWQHTQIIKVQDDTAPVINSSCDDITVCSYADDCSGANVELVLDAEDACAIELNYDYQIDADSDGTIDLSGSTNDASGEYPLGTHTIYWSVEDGCGNITQCEYRFKVVDCKKPSPVCINGLSTVVMPTTGEIVLWASDFNAPGTSGSFDNCTAQEDLRLRIRKVTPDQNSLTSLNQVLNLDTNVSFSCDDLGFPNVELYVIDEAGNWDYCTTYVVIQDNNNVCPTGELADIAGHVETEFEEMVENVNIDVTGTSSIPAILTGNDGAFQFSNVLLGGNYTVTPEKDVDYLNGVTTYDLVLVSKHILGLNQLDSPYKIIAADANHSGSVTTLDMVQIRRLILNIDTELSSNTSWRFVEKDFVFPNATNPFQTIFPEVININELSVNEMDADFVAVKVGDVNGSAVPNTLLGVQNRNFAGTLVFDVNDVKMEAGQTYTVAFKANKFTEMLGYQFALELDTNAAQIVDVEAGALKQLSAENFGLAQASAGIVTTSWDNVNLASLKDGQTVFTLTIEATKATKLSEVLAISTKSTAAEAYTADATDFDVAIAFNGENGTTVAGAGFELFQNEPNPFQAVTNISFNLPTASKATLTVYNVSGQVLKVVEDNFSAGQNTITLDRNELGSAGMLYYQLDTETDSATRKMILVD